jgi:IS30 family transposase
VAGHALSMLEREEISRGLARGETLASIGRRLGRHRSVISREVARNNSHHFGYRAVYAQRHAGRRCRRPRRAKLKAPGPLRTRVVELLAARWSPQQIAARLRLDYPDQPEMQVSHETIYQAIYVQSRGGLRREVAAALRTGRTRRRHQQRSSPAGAARNHRPWITLRIADRPPEVADRAVPGHWEGDLLMGAGNRSAIATLVERNSRFVLLCPLRHGRRADAVAAALSAKMTQLPEALRRSLTWDQGTEMAQHAQFSVATGAPVYFCDPHSPWQRGSNENTNGLLRQYFPKGRTDFSTITEAELDAVATELNARPRQTLNWRTPAEQLNDTLVALTT